MGVPPKGARAVVEVTPNPATRGEAVVITGDCGGGTGLRNVVGGSREHEVLRDVRIVDAGPGRFEATARLSETVGHGVGPVVVDCGGEAGVTLLVTRA